MKISLRIKILSALALLFLVLFLFLVFNSRNLLLPLLNRKYTIGQTSITLYQAKWSRFPGLNFDSLHITRPELSVKAYEGGVNLSWARDSWTKLSTFTLAFDSIHVKIFSDSQKTSPSIDSVIAHLPKIQKVGMPFKFSLNSRILAILLQGPNPEVVSHLYINNLLLQQRSSGFYRVQSHGLVYTGLPSEVKLDSITAGLSWDPFGAAKIEGRFHHKNDSLIFDARSPKGQLKETELQFQMAVREPASWINQFAPNNKLNSPNAAVRFENFQAKGLLQLSQLDFQIDIGVDWKGIKQSSQKSSLDSVSLTDSHKPLILYPQELIQNIGLGLTKKGPALIAQAKIKASKAAGEGMFTLQAQHTLAGVNKSFDTLGTLPFKSWTLRGLSQDMYWPLGRDTLPLNLRHINGYWQGQAGTLSIETEAGSKINLQRSLDEPEFAWTLNAKVAPLEPWAVQWTRGHVSFSQALVKGGWKGNSLNLKAQILKPRAYGFYGDTLLTWQKISANQYKLDSGILIQDSIVHHINGEVNWVAGQEGILFNLNSLNQGLAKIQMSSWHELLVELKDYHTPTLPLMALDKSRSLLPTSLEGAFYWDLLANSGYSRVQGRWDYRQQKLDWKLSFDWNNQFLQLDTLAIKHQSNFLQLNALCKVPQINFYSCFQGLDSHWVAINLSQLSTEFKSIEKFFGWESHTNFIAQGNIYYEPQKGFQGQINLDQIEIPWRGESFRVKELNIKGENRGLRLTALTADNKEAFLNDTIVLEIDNIFASNLMWQLQGRSENLDVAGKGNFSNKTLLGNLTLQANRDFDWGKLSVDRADATLYWPLQEKALRKIEISGLKGHYISLLNDSLELSGQMLYTEAGLQIPQLLMSHGTKGLIQLRGQGQSIKQWEIFGQVKGLNIKVSPQLAIAVPDAKILAKSQGGGYSVNSQLAQAGISMQTADGQLDLDLVKSQLGINKDTSDQHMSFEGQFNIENFLFKSELLDVKKWMGKLLRLSRNSPKQVKANKHKRLFSSVNVRISTLGANNRIDSDVVKAYLSGDVTLGGTWPYLLWSGELNALSGQFGFGSQLYTLDEFSVLWRDDPLEEGQIKLVGQKTIAEKCNPPTTDSCQVQVLLTGNLQNPQFSYDGTCTGELGESIEPIDVITSATRGCFGSQGSIGNASRALVGVLLDQTLSEIASKNAQRYIRAIDQVKVSGSSTVWGPGKTEADSQTTSTGALEKENALSVQLRSKAYRGLRLIGNYKYFTGQEYSRPEELSGGLEWIPALEGLSQNSTWQHRVKNRFKMEGMVKSVPAEKTNVLDTESKRLRLNLNLGYVYDFWEVW